jgi:hypothetical protein
MAVIVVKSNFYAMTLHTLVKAPPTMRAAVPHSDNQVWVVIRNMVLRLVAWSMILRMCNRLADLLQGLTRWR